MPGVSIALRMLSLFVEPNTAAAHLRYLREKTGNGGLLFWLRVLWACAKLSMRNLVSAPLRVGIVLLIGICLIRLGLKLWGEAWILHPEPADLIGKYLWYEAFRFCKIVICHSLWVFYSPAWPKTDGKFR